jgi:small subunit ribosomal protein S4
MARYIGPVCRLCRREKTKLFLKGAKCMMSKCPVDKGRNPPGQHGIRRRKVSEYGLQLREKQKLRRIYGILEKQFRNYFRRADRQKGMTGKNLLQMLETRLDSVVLRLGFAPAIRSARQFVRHGHIKVNGRRIDYPAYQVKVGDVIEVRDRGTSRQRAAESLESRSWEVPGWLDLNKNKFRAGVIKIPEAEDIQLPEGTVDVSLVVGLYSKY